MEIFPENVRRMWNNWELRILILLSLSWQILLIIFGPQRKYSCSSFTSFLVWVIYLSADWLATVSLGTLANSQGDKHNSDSHTEKTNQDLVLRAFWAPFLLLHLGGPDTITAYSLEDNSLWLRHLLGLVVQVAVAFYIFLRSWSNTALTFIAIPVFISGILKYSERTWVLRSASTQQFEDSLLSASAPCLQASAQSHNVELQCLHNAYSLFSLLKHLYANLSLRFAQGQRSYSLLVKGGPSSENAFKLVELQLGFLYDVLYTKAMVIFSPTGIIFRFITFFCTLFALVAFHIFIDNSACSKFDLYVTYALFVGAVFLEIYAAISLVFSEWTALWLTKKRTPSRKIIYSALSYCKSVLPHKKRWSESMAQHNLVSFCLKHGTAGITACIGTDFLFGIYFTLKLHWQRKWENVDADLKRLIFEHLIEKNETYRQSGFDYNELKKLQACRGDSVLRKNHCLDAIGWSVEVEFGHSLLIWHVATDICFQSDPDSHQSPSCQASKKISDYMLYVLLMRPFMLPKWIDRISFVRDTYREATSILRRKEFQVKGIADACNMMFELQTHCKSLEPLRREKTSKSVLLEACSLSEQLRLLNDHQWETICQVWIEMLTYAASHCEWQAHAQQLQRGGELLTHVCLVTVDLGLSEQFDFRRRESATENQCVGWGWGKSKTSPYIISL